MDRAGLSEAEFSAIFGISPGLLQDWLAGTRPVPSWVLPTIQMLYLLSPAVRQRLLRDMPLQQGKMPEPPRKQIKSHPFSRIEDL
jgi:transcriptional regulator with XRE-family HTH domain